MTSKEPVLRPAIGDKITWEADNAGGHAVVTDVYHDCVNGIPSALPRIMAKDPQWSKPACLMPYEFELEGDDEATISAEATRKHIQAVDNLLRKFASHLSERGRVHDASKLRLPEMPIFAEQTAKLKDLVYGTPEYMEAIKNLGPALTHHYEHNDHHPEHHADGIDGMDLMQLVEMYCDWCAAAMRMKDGSIEQSIDKNVDRFGMSPQLERIFRNTAARGMR